MLFDSVPFLVGILLLFAQAAFDRTWLRTYEDFYRKNPFTQDEGDGLAVGDLATSVRWSTDMSQFLPSAGLVIVGIALLLKDKQDGYVTVGLLSTLGWAVVVYNREADSDDLHDVAKLRYGLTRLQRVLLGLNVVGLLFVLLLPGDQTEKRCVLRATSVSLAGTCGETAPGGALLLMVRAQ